MQAADDDLIACIPILKLDGSSDGNCDAQADDRNDKGPEDDEEDLSRAPVEDVREDEVAVEGDAWFLNLRLSALTFRADRCCYKQVRTIQKMSAKMLATSLPVLGASPV
jgi:hypothetical protein